MRVVLADATGAESDLVLGTNYTVALNADQDANPGGTVTTTAAYATGYTLTLTSGLQNLQPVTLTNNGGFYPTVINNALDRLTILVQQLAEQVGRAVKVSISSVTSPDSLVAQRAADGGIHALTYLQQRQRQRHGGGIQRQRCGGERRVVGRQNGHAVGNRGAAVPQQH